METGVGDTLKKNTHKIENIFTYVFKQEEKDI